MDIRATLQRADALQRSGKLAEAEALYLSVANGPPGIGNDAKPFADAVHNAGAMALMAGRYDDAISRIDRALGLRPRELSYRRNLAIALVNSKLPANLERACEEVQRALVTSPGDPMLLELLAVAADAAGRKLEAARAWKRLADLSPQNGNARFNAGILFQQGGKNDEAIDCYRRFLAEHPTHPQHVHATSNLAFLLGVMHEKEETLVLLRRLEKLGQLDVSLKPLYALLLVEAGTFGKAEALLAEAEDPSTPSGITDPLMRQQRTVPYIFAAYYRLGRYREAEDYSRRYADLIPADAQSLPGLLSINQYLYPDVPSELLKLHRRFDEEVSREVVPMTPAPFVPVTGRRLRVGYVSGDFRDHSVGFFFEPLLVNHDNTRVDIHLFSNSTKRDARAERMKAAAARWHDVTSLSDSSLAELIRQCGIDVLVDLSGHTEGSRVAMFAYRPAPVQLTYLGYSSTTGLSAIDGLITDPVCDPEGNEAHFCERLLRLPDVFAVYRPLAEMTEVTPAPSAVNQHVTVASVAAPSKINEGVLDAWAEGLRTAASSHFLMIGTGFDDNATQRRFRAAFEARGIEATRLKFRGRLPFAQYVAMHSNIDMIVDTFPFNGHTTTVQNLWMGVPVVTYAGKSHRSRMGASVLAAIGLPELIAHREEDFGPLIARWASDPAGLATLRREMRSRMKASPLMDEVKFARDFEDLLINAFTTKLQTGHV